MKKLYAKDYFTPQRDYFFLLCHLSGGDQNRHCHDYYEIELVVTYKCNPAFEFSNKIKIKYLIDEMPNKEQFKSFLRDKKILKTLKEGIKSVKILFLKKYYLLKS